ncbi:MAG: toprim domain-containing protein [Candidatus Woesearchaeota archaeon]
MKENLNFNRDYKIDNIYNNLKDLYDEIDYIKKGNFIIIVEGKKDKKALLDLGVNENKIFFLKKDIYSFSLEISKKLEKDDKVIILTDFDNEGIKLYKKIKEVLEKEHVKINNNLRERIKKLEIKHIEGLHSYIDNFFSLNKKYIDKNIDINKSNT